MVPCRLYMSSGANVADSQGQSRLTAFQSLTLGFLVTAEHERFLGRMEVETDDIPEFLPNFGSFDSLNGVR